MAPKKRLDDLKARLETTRRAHPTDENASRLREILIEMENMLEREEIYWLQRCRANWLKNGDRNTNFFHNFASARKKRDFIKRLKGDDGTDELGALISAYFTNLFSVDVVNLGMEVINKVNPRVTEYMNNSLTAPYTAEEVKKIFV